MRIIKPGNSQAELYRGTCPACGCRFECEKKELAGRATAFCPQAGCDEVVSVQLHRTGGVVHPKIPPAGGSGTAPPRRSAV